VPARHNQQITRHRDPPQLSLPGTILAQLLFAQALGPKPLSHREHRELPSLVSMAPPTTFWLDKGVGNKESPAASYIIQRRFCGPNYGATNGAQTATAENSEPICQSPSNAASSTSTPSAGRLPSYSTTFAGSMRAGLASQRYPSFACTTHIQQPPWWEARDLCNELNRFQKHPEDDIHTSSVDVASITDVCTEITGSNCITTDETTNNGVKTKKHSMDVLSAEWNPSKHVQQRAPAKADSQVRLVQ
jgi:hypothetical protein